MFDLSTVSDYELGYLLGVYKGDGSATSGNKPFFRINGGIDKEMNDRVSGILTKMGIKHRNYNDGRYFRLYVTPKNGCEELTSWLDEAFQHYHLASRDEKIGFVAGYYDSEGHLRNAPHSTCPTSIQNQVEISDSQHNELVLVSGILSELGIEHSFRPKKMPLGALPQERIGIYSRDRISHFLQLVNPAIPRKAHI